MSSAAMRASGADWRVTTIRPRSERARSSRAKLMPSTPGRPRSRTTTSRRVSCISARQANASLASWTAKPGPPQGQGDCPAGQVFVFDHGDAVQGPVSLACETYPAGASFPMGSTVLLPLRQQSVNIRSSRPMISCAVDGPSTDAQGSQGGDPTAPACRGATRALMRSPAGGAEGGKSSRRGEGHAPSARVRRGYLPGRNDDDPERLHRAVTPRRGR